MPFQKWIKVSSGILQLNRSHLVDYVYAKLIESFGFCFLHSTSSLFSFLFILFGIRPRFVEFECLYLCVCKCMRVQVIIRSVSQDTWCTWTCRFTQPLKFHKKRERNETEKKTPKNDKWDERMSKWKGHSTKVYKMNSNAAIAMAMATATSHNSNIKRSVMDGITSRMSELIRASDYIFVLCHCW